MYVGAENHRKMRVLRRRQAKRFHDVELSRRIVQMIVTSHHMSYSHVVTIDDNGKIIGWRAVGPQYNQIVQLSILERHLPHEFDPEPLPARGKGS